MDTDVIKNSIYAVCTAQYWSVSLWKWVLSAAVLFLSFPVKRWVEKYVILNLVKVFDRGSGKYGKLIVKALYRPAGALVFLGGIHLSIWILSFGEPISADLGRILKFTYFFAFTVILIWTIYRLINVVVVWAEDVAKRNESGFKQFTPFLRQTLRILVFIVGALTILSALDVDIGGFVAGLGIGGIAVALAAKDSLGNFFGSIGLIADRPFQVGDWVKVGEKWEGFIEEIGFRSTKIRTLPKSLLTIPNQSLANEAIENLSSRPKRRVKHTIGVLYETPPEKIEEAVKGIKMILETDVGIHKEFILVRFAEFGACSLDILLIYFTTGTSGQEHYSTRERVNLRVIRFLEEIGVSIAYPTRTVHFSEPIPHFGGKV